MPEAPEVQTFAVDPAETAPDSLGASAIAPVASSGIATPGYSGHFSPEALAQSARADQSSLQRHGAEELSRIERARRQLAPRSLWPDRFR